MAGTCVIDIFVCPEKGGKMQSVLDVKAITGAGLEGDRYGMALGSWNEGKPGKRQVSFIANEDVLNVNSTIKVPYRACETRRNILTSGVDLMNLIGKEFTIGTVKFRGIEYCNPCDRPDKLSGNKGFKTMFEHTAGILAEVLTDGVIKVGATIKIVPEGGRMVCIKCSDTGVIETGNNDLPCDCPAGDAALFNQAGIEGQVTGAEIRRHFLNNSPEPIHPGRDRIPASSLPGRQK